ncbi:solute carrier family 35 member b1 [Anaeramoeba ignava]|uniref:Solute carrier family 35 member b1 n=1 Tax=Anaeramoeba ignava TaxID=1746090 RepID=A0A9Q0L761_ANAIG|nr:solute carrier family 35 member b1 [Anaeramoeba ignava]
MFKSTSFWKFISSSLGIYFFFMAFGMFHEELLSTKYSEKEFNLILFLNFVFDFVNSIIGFFGDWIISRKIKRIKAPRYIPPYKILVLSIMSLTTDFLGQKGSLLTNYPTQVLMKASKPLTILFVGQLIFKRKYSIRNSKFHSTTQSIDSKYFLGLIFLVVDLIIDGFFGSYQDKLKKQYEKPSLFYQMKWINGWKGLILGIFLLLNKNIFQGINFCLTNRHLGFLIIACALSMAFGQVFIFFAVNNFDALTVSIITTTRKFFTIVLSFFVFKHSFNSNQFLGIFLVFGFLLFDLIMSSFETKQKEN